MGVMAGISSIFGAPEAAVILMVSLFAGYPLSIVYKKYIRQQDAITQQAFFAGTGFILMYINCGTDIWHSTLSILVAYVLTNFLGSSIHAVIGAFIFFMGHLLIGYYATESDQYDITWTMPQCILCLRLIGLVWDVYDGHSKPEDLSADQKTTALKEPPTLLEIFSFCWFFGGFLVGPQFPLMRFRHFISGELYGENMDEKKKEALLDNTIPSMKRLIPGLLYLFAHMYLAPTFSNDYLLGKDFKKETYFWKWIYAICWYRIALLKYMAAWLITEGSGILCGLSYNGKDPKTGEVQWNGLKNLSISIFELGVSFQSIIDSFNINTNQWSARYVFKRLKFLGNKSASHVLTLAFLAVWHGFHLGYFACFFMEYATVMGEKNLVLIIKRLPKLDAFLRGPAEIPTKIACKILMTFGSCFGFLPFGLIKTFRWWPVYAELWWAGWLVFVVLWPITFQVLLRVVPKPPKTTEKKSE